MRSKIRSPLRKLLPLFVESDDIKVRGEDALCHSLGSNLRLSGKKDNWSVGFAHSPCKFADFR